MNLGIDELIPESLSSYSGIGCTLSILFIDYCFIMIRTIIMKQWLMNVGTDELIPESLSRDSGISCTL